MNKNQVFGDLRGLLFAPSDANWAQICTLMASVPEVQQREEVIPYVRHHLARWPVEMCMAPWAWIAPLFAGEAPPAMLSMARAVEVVARKNIHHGFRRFIQNDALSHIEYLNIEACSIGGTRSFNALAQASQLEHLGALSLKLVKMADDHLSALLDAGLVHAVRELHFEGNNLSPRAVEMITSHEIIVQLEELHLDSNPIEDTGCKLLSHAAFESLRLLSLGTGGIGDEGVRHLARSEHLSQLKWLELAQNEVTSKGISALANAASMASLEVLSLWSNPLGDDVGRVLGQRDGMLGLRQLSLGDAGVGSLCMEHLSDSEKSSTLETLCLRVNGVDEVGCKAMGSSPHFAALTSLFLSSNPCTTAGIASLCDTPSWQNIRQLELAGTRLSTWQVFEACDALTSLEVLDLTGNPLTFPTVDFSACQKFKHLKLLGLDHCGVDESGLNTILSCIDTGGLKALYLAYNELDDDEVRRLVQYPFAQLTYLSIVGCYYTSESKDAELIAPLIQAPTKRVDSRDGTWFLTFSANRDAETVVL